MPSTGIHSSNNSLSPHSINNKPSARLAVRNFLDELYRMPGYHRNNRKSLRKSEESDVTKTTLGILTDTASQSIHYPPGGSVDSYLAERVQIHHPLIRTVPVPASYSGTAVDETTVLPRTSEERSTQQDQETKEEEATRDASSPPAAEGGAITSSEGPPQAQSSEWLALEKYRIPCMTLEDKLRVLQKQEKRSYFAGLEQGVVDQQVTRVGYSHVPGFKGHIVQVFTLDAETLQITDVYTGKTRGPSSFWKRWLFRRRSIPTRRLLWQAWWEEWELTDEERAAEELAFQQRLLETNFFAF